GLCRNGRIGGARHGGAAAPRMQVHSHRRQAQHPHRRHGKLAPPLPDSRPAPTHAADAGGLRRAIALPELARIASLETSNREPTVAGSAALETSGWLRGVDLNHRPLGYEPNGTSLTTVESPRLTSSFRATFTPTI